MKTRFLYLVSFLMLLSTGCATYRDNSNNSGKDVAFTNKMHFISVPAGEFRMGSPKGEGARDEDEGQVQVKLTQDFEMQATEVTQLQWFKVMGTNPSYFKSEKDCGSEHQVFGKIELCPNYPVEGISWDNVQKFIIAFNQQKNDGYSYRLPTEAEWEYAARAGTTTAYSFGNNSEDLRAYGWYSDNSNKKAHRVGQKKANPWGLYDIHGNVWEWVQDAYAQELPRGTNPLQSSGRNRVVRGGSWGSGAEFLRSANRHYGVFPGISDFFVGVRLVRTMRQ